MQRARRPPADVCGSTAAWPITRRLGCRSLVLPPTPHHRGGFAAGGVRWATAHALSGRDDRVPRTPVTRRYTDDGVPSGSDLLKTLRQGLLSAFGSPDDSLTSWPDAEPHFGAMPPGASVSRFQLVPDRTRMVSRCGIRRSGPAGVRELLKRRCLQLFPCTVRHGGGDPGLLVAFVRLTRRVVRVAGRSQAQSDAPIGPGWSAPGTPRQCGLADELGQPRCRSSLRPAVLCPRLPRRRAREIARCIADMITLQVPTPCRTSRAGERAVSAGSLPPPDRTTGRPPRILSRHCHPEGAARSCTHHTTRRRKMSERPGRSSLRASSQWRARRHHPLISECRRNPTVLYPGAHDPPRLIIALSIPDTRSSTILRFDGLGIMSRRSPEALEIAGVLALSPNRESRHKERMLLPSPT